MDAKFLPLKSVRNPRDLGGYVGADGRKIKDGLLLRTGMVSCITPEDAAFLQRYGVKTIIDLRSPAECLNQPDAAIEGIKDLHIPVSSRDRTKAGASLRELAELYKADPLAGFKHMLGTYQRMVTAEHSQKAFHRILSFLAEAEGGTIFHCSEGKDRTGMTAVLLLYLLGVDEETIRQDYLASGPALNDYRKKRDEEARANGESLIQRANLRSLGTVNNEYLDSALVAIEQNYGGMERFLAEEIAVTPDLRRKLQEKYLEK